MAVGTLVIELVGALLIACGILWSYGNIPKATPAVITAVLIAWYFSLCIVTILPNDISATFYRQCVEHHSPTPANVTTISPPVTTPPQPVDLDQEAPVPQTYNQYPMNSDYSYLEGHERQKREMAPPPVTTPPPDTTHCIKPASLVPSPQVVPTLYKIVYWSTQLLTWLLIPFLSSYVQSGEFTILSKAKTALIDNAIYYGIYLIIFVILLVYAAASRTWDLSFANLKIVGISAANTWGLFLLVLLLGYGLVEIPRSFWHRSSIQHQIEWEYFNLAKITEEKHEAVEELENVLQEAKKISENVRFGHPCRKHVNTIIKKCPEEFQDQLAREAEDYREHNDANVPSQRTLVRLHKKLNKGLQRERRTQTQFKLFLKRALHNEDVIKNSTSVDKIWKTYYSTDDSRLPGNLKWYWRCQFRSYFMKLLSISSGIMSVIVIWSECTFWVQAKTLSIFALLVQYWSEQHNYFNLELFCFISIAYLCFCAYWTLFQIKLFNIYFIAPNHQTDDYSLLFIGMFLCRLTPPLCLNFLGLVHLDSRISDGKIDTAYTTLMGHLELVSDGFNIYFPILIVLLCVGTWFKVGTRCLSSIGFAQFLQSDELTTDLMEEGKAFVNREKRRIEREWRKEDRWNNNSSPSGGTAYRNTKTGTASGTARRGTEERVSLLRDGDSDDENGNWPNTGSSSFRSETRRPNRSLFDDV